MQNCVKLELNKDNFYLPIWKNLRLFPNSQIYNLEIDVGLVDLWCNREALPPLIKLEILLRYTATLTFGWLINCQITSLPIRGWLGVEMRVWTGWGGESRDFS